MGFKVTSTGNFKNTETYLFNHRKSAFSEDELIKIAEYGLSRFISNTPRNSGKTASSWSYEIVDVNGKKTITYSNDNIYYRRHVDNGFTNWRRLAFANEIPTSLKNPHALTISLNGTS